jgi:dienelactone hydrolase
MGLAGALAGPSPAAAVELVKFPPAGTTGTVAIPSSQPESIQGYLARPKGRGPFPAVILLHSCLGLPSNWRDIETTLTDWGYVALFVDDFATRGLSDTCSVDFPAGLADAFGALVFLAGRPEVDRGRIAAVGFSQGAATALEIASGRFAGRFARPAGLAYRAVAAFYPACEGQSAPRLPTLVLVGAEDTVTPAAPCERLLSPRTGTGGGLVVYPGAAHVFDDPKFTGGKRVMGMWLQFDSRAAAQSRTALQAFLATELGR